MVFNGGVVLLYIYTESVEEKKYDEEGKEKEYEEKSVAQTWLDLNSAP